MTHVRLFFKYLRISIQSQMMYKGSFILQAAGNFIVTFIEMVGIIFLFRRFGRLMEWTLPEVAFLYGIINISFALAESLGRGFDLFSEQIKQGLFDRVLVRPRPTGFQVAASEVQLLKIGRLLQGLAVLIWAGSAGDIQWSVLKILLVLGSTGSGAALFYGLFIIKATLSFWTTETLELMNIVTYGGTETSQYPMPIYRTWFRRFFIFVIPLACVNYFPMLAVFEKKCPLGSPVWLHWTSPIAGFLFLGICMGIWNFGVKHYHSTGS
jgi:ABC-2 type transport system permease protein